ncbi:hypothetical protein RJ639_019097 [Escallonia herrerae]|uniref:Pentatricopeptide repeat-containing protein n=1 Tax=Escallonia herrerae TaxID=1293975 RepID=A0AA88V6R5_9ASTE|nr:hypothetical protein RJ639_019097 [Escallonia herrerae]
MIDPSVEIFLRMSEMDFSVSPYATSTMFCCLVDYKRISVILDVNAMMVSGLRQEWSPYLSLYNFVIVGSFKKDEVEMGLEFHRAMIERGFALKAFGLFGLMIKHGIEPSVVTYSCLIDVICKSGNLRDGLEQLGYEIKLYTQMGKLDVLPDRGFAPDVVTYCTLIDGFCEKRNLTAGLLIFKLMLKNGVYPDIAVYNVLISMFFMEGRVKNALELFRQVSEVGPKPDTVT